MMQAIPRDETSGACPQCGALRRRITVNTVGFDLLDAARFLEAVDRFVDCGRSHAVHFLAAHPTVLARRDPEYRELLNGADLAVADGAPIAALLRLRDRSARRLTSTDGFLRLCRHSARRRGRHFFLGGANDEVARAVRASVEQSFPGLEIAGSEVPPFRAYDDEELRALAEEIRASGAEVVWVGIGAPKQDVLAQRLRREQAAPVIICIGATFDFVAGTKRRAPGWLRAIGLEWLFRLALEPRRLWRRYLIGNAQFLGGVGADLIRGRR
jgi:N-acetylglucosaminyldiphosphoundecaprenol N-acetyl-beta-D-mannosaminyltransferase